MITNYYPRLGKGVGDGGKGNANLVYCARIGLVWDGIAILIYLVYGILGCAVIFEFHYVDILVGFDHHVDAAIACVLLHTDAHPHEGENYVKHILIMLFAIQNQVIVATCQQRLQTLEECIDFATSHLVDKLVDFKAALSCAQIDIIGKQILQESLPYLIIREPKA